MKLQFIIPVISSILVTGCAYERTYVPTPENLSAVLVEEQWRIKFFSPNDYERTAEFADHRFMFTVNNVVSCFNPVTHELKSGSYSISGTDSTVFLTLNFGIEPKYQDFNYEWQVLEITSKLVRAEHGQSGNGNTSYLTFEK